MTGKGNQGDAKSGGRRHIMKCSRHLKQNNKLVNIETRDSPPIVRWGNNSETPKLDLHPGDRAPETQVDEYDNQRDIRSPRYS